MTDQTAQHPAAPETDVSALTETERGWLDEWRDRCDADSTLMRHEGYVELLDDILRYRLVAARERLRVVEGELDAAQADRERCWDEGYQRGLRDAEQDVQHGADNPYRGLLPGDGR